MIRELRGYDPKPGLPLRRRAGAGGRRPTCSSRGRRRGLGDRDQRGDAAARAGQPRAIMPSWRPGRRTRRRKAWLGDCLASANWLVKALDQRQRTIIKVATEIVKQQEAFFLHGVAHLRPLTLRAVADAIEMHESTVSRVTCNKYLQLRARAVRAEIFLHQRRSSRPTAATRCRPRRSRARSEALIAAEGAQDPVRRHAGRAAQRQGLRHRAAHRRQISRGDRDRQLGPAPPGACAGGMSRPQYARGISPYA